MIWAGLEERLSASAQAATRAAAEAGSEAVRSALAQFENFLVNIKTYPHVTEERRAEDPGAPAPAQDPGAPEDPRRPGQLLRHIARRQPVG